MRLDDVARDGEAEPGAVWAGGEEGLEDAGAQLGRHAGAGVGDRDLDRALRRGADDGERAPYLVRDGGGELAERGELLALGEARARRGDRLGLRADGLGLAPVAPAALDDVADEEPEEGERGAEPGRHQRAR